MHFRLGLAALALTLALAGCGGASTQDQSAAAATNESGSEDTASTALRSPPELWASMDHDARADWMRAEVVPHMQAAFADYDRARFANVGCRTCHGANAREEGFAMPSRSLPALPATGTPEQRQMVRDYPEGTRFMFNHVMPSMQTLLGAAPFDAATGEGFTCFACHPHAGDEGTDLIRLTTPIEPDPADAADPADGADGADGADAGQGS